MKADTLRTILLVKAVEEHDADGALLTLAERDGATRDALRRWPAGPIELAREDRERHLWRVAAARAEQLYARLAQRHPVVVHTVMLETSASRIVLGVLVVALVIGLALSLFDSRVRIEIVAFPLLGLVLWNLAVYVALAVAWLRRGRATTAPAAASMAGWPARWAWRRAATLIRRSAFYHRPLAAALRRFSDEWWPLAQPLLWRQGRRLFHAGAAAIAVGLVAGYYIRGIGLEYRAGWESTFLDPSRVRAFLRVIYGPAAAVTGIGLPADTAAVEALRWRGGTGGGPAAMWIHLMAATALLFIIVPRALLALAETIGLGRASARVTPPETLLPYARNVLDGHDLALPAERVRVTAYAYRPEAEAIEGARRLLRAAWGAGTQVAMAPTIAYGAEATYAPPAPGDAIDVETLLFNLAATPEVENHGAMLSRAVESATTSAGRTRMLALIDESPYLAVMQGDASLTDRIEQRREAWRAFVTRHGAAACLVDLATLVHGESIDVELVRRVHGASRGGGSR